MKATIRDADVLASLAPLGVAAYLRSKNWRQTAAIGDKGSVWTFRSVDDGQFEILLPLNRELRDFAARMGDLLHTLEIVESHEHNQPRSQLEILADITNSTSDVLRIRLADAENGTLPIEQGVRVVEQARDLLLAAACATVQPRSAYQTRKPTQATEYLGHVRIGAPERGSFVLAIRSEVPPRLVNHDEPDLLEIEEPFERRVMLMLAGGLTAARNAAQHAGATGDWQPFTDAVRLGVSANLCDAIVGLALDCGGAPVTMSFSWAPTRAVIGPSARRITMDADMVPFLKEAARVFRANTPLEDFELRGVVVRLDRAEAAECGRVTVAAAVDQNVRRVQIELARGDYDLAITAHQNDQPVYCEGELSRDGRSYVLRNPRAFRIDAEPDHVG